MAHAFLKAAATIMVAAGYNRPIDRLCEILSSIRPAQVTSLRAAGQ